MISCSKEFKGHGSENEFNTTAKRIVRTSPSLIGEKEIRDTSFSMPLNTLGSPLAFMRAITDIQMLNREDRDTFNYSEKLLFSDSILTNICQKIINSRNEPVYLLERMTCAGEELYYDLSVKNSAQDSFTNYILIGDKMAVDRLAINGSLQKIIDEWDKDSMLSINEKPDYLVLDTSIHYGCATRLKCDNDSVHIDMVKFYMWPFDYPYCREPEYDTFDED